MLRLLLACFVFAPLILVNGGAEICKSVELINDALVTLRQTEFYEDLEDIMVKYVMHFEYNETMTIKTKQGLKKIKRDEDILKFDNFLIHSTVAVEYARKKIVDVSFRFDYPIHAFRFIRNNTIVLQTIIKKMVSTFKHYRDTERTDLMKALKKYTEHPPFPRAQDLKAITVALLELQEIYALKAADIAEGVFLGDRSERLNTQECMEIADHAKNDGKIKLYISWLEAARQKMENNNDRTVEKLHVYQNLNDAYKHVGCQCVKQASIIRNQLIQLQPDNTTETQTTTDQCKLTTEETCVHKLTKAEKTLNKHLNNTDLNFKKLCQTVTKSQSVVTVNQSKSRGHLSCKYERTMNSFYFINPFKVEILNFKPQIWLVHDLIDSYTRDFLIHHGVANVQVEHRENISITLPPNKVRATATTLKSKRQLKLVTSIQKKTAALSDTDLKSFNQFVLVNYGIAGYDKPTLVQANRNSQSVSITIFLTNVHSGGEIVFPNKGVSVKPVERNALIVFQEYQNSAGNDIITHGACPVVKGNKWIATQTI